MIRAWYEKKRDVKDHIYFALHRYEKAPVHHLNRFPGFHNAIEFAFGLEGCIRIVIGGKEQFLHAGEVCFMNSREPHRYYYDGGTACYIVLISSSFFNEINKLGSISFPTHCPECEGFAEVRKYLDYALAHWDEESMLCKSGFADTFAYLMTKYYPAFPKKEMEAQSATLLKAVEYVCEHFTEDLTVSSVARLFGYSANYFSTAFRSFIGTGFPEFLNTCRMIEYEHVRKTEPDIPDVRAAEKCGFGSMNTFYRAKRKFYDDTGAPLNETED